MVPVICYQFVGQIFGTYVMGMRFQLVVRWLLLLSSCAGLGLGYKCMLHCPVPCSTILSDCTINGESTRGCMNVCIFEYSSVCDV